MNTSSRTPLALLLAGSLLLGITRLAGQGMPATIDDLSNPTVTSIGAPRIVIDDSSMGGKSHLTPTYADGIMSAKGEIAPARGQPGWVSLVLPLAEPGQSADLSAYEGIRLRVRVLRGNLSVSANSTVVDNFDYHAAPIVRSADGDFHEVRIPFASMKRAWSAQTPLDPATINSISLVAANVQPGPFAYEVDEVGFY